MIGFIDGGSILFDVEGLERSNEGKQAKASFQRREKLVEHAGTRDTQEFFICF